jgi:hypothetical protein
MATTNLAAISAALSLILMDSNVKQFRRDCPILHMIPVEKGAGKVCVINAKVKGRTAAGAYSEGADMADGDFESDVRINGSLNWASYREGVKISGLASAVAASSGGTHNAGDSDLWAEEMVDAIDSLADKLGEDIYAGDASASPVELAGAAQAIDDDTGTSFAGIDPATYSDWLGNETTFALASISVALLREKIFRPIKDATGRYPDVVTCSGAIFDQVVGLGDGNTLMDIRVLGNEIRLADLGARAVMVDGVPFVEDRHCTSNTLYGWSMRDVCLKQLPSAITAANVKNVQQALKQLVGEEIPLSDIESGLQRMRGQLTPTVEVLGQTGDAYKAQVKVYAQLKWRRRNSHVKCTVT